MTEVNPQNSGRLATHFPSTSKLIAVQIELKFNPVKNLAVDKELPAPYRGKLFPTPCCSTPPLPSIIIFQFSWGINDMSDLENHYLIGRDEMFLRW
ncbi:Hypothetical protein VS_1449 [Vibrio atlanticus]|uniref:Uncharacterized protein n=1 Tax=Vibrio atlanticus (strain LGP32) TaxID=575788 RepID=B7VNN6_VIBA3|nr:Hypothetical protein VS_1449 [Vibrio atlanticus]